MQEQSDVAAPKAPRVSVVISEGARRELSTMFKKAAEEHAKIEKVVRGPLLDLLEKHGVDLDDPAYGNMIGGEILAAARLGHRGIDAVHVAARWRRAGHPGRALTPARQALSTRRCPVARVRTREHGGNQSRRATASVRGPDDPEPPLPPRCQGCGGELVGRRPQTKFHNDACRKRAERGARLADIPAHEPDVVAFVAAGELDFLSALDWLTDPVGARDLHIGRLVAA